MAPRPMVRRKSRGRASTKIIRKANRTRKASGLELEIHAMLKAEKIPFVKEKTISQCTVDIFIAPCTIIELQGCYWHGCQSCSKKLTADQKKTQGGHGRRHPPLRAPGSN